MAMIPRAVTGCVMSTVHDVKMNKIWSLINIMVKFITEFINQLNQMLNFWFGMEMNMQSNSVYHCLKKNKLKIK